MKFCTIIFFSPPHPASLVPCAAPAFVSPPLPSEDEQNTTTTCRARAHFSSSPRLPAAAAAHNPVLPAPCLVLLALAHTLSSIWGCTPQTGPLSCSICKRDAGVSGCSGFRDVPVNSPLAKSQGLLDAQLGDRRFRNPLFHLLWCRRANASPKSLREVTGFTLISLMLA